MAGSSQYYLYSSPESVYNQRMSDDTTPDAEELQPENAQPTNDMRSEPQTPINEARNEPLKPIDEIRLEKIKKYEAIKKLNVDPFPAKPIHSTIPILEARNTKVNATVAIAGRVTSIRTHGGITFADLKDQSGEIQLAFKRDQLSEEQLQLLHLIDVNDFIEVQGTLFNTQTGELTIAVQDLHILTKAIRPLPEPNSLKDQETRYRKRYLEFATNPELHELFEKKALFWQTIRNFMLKHNFLEVETPVLENVAGGADANPFVTHHDALDFDIYLRISMGELWQKRLLVGGFERTFEIGRQFRNEGISAEHLQDYSQMEFYWAYHNYEDGMQLVEQMYQDVAQKVFNTTQFTIGKFNIELAGTWPKIDYVSTVEDKLDINVLTATDDELRQKLDELKVAYLPIDQRGRLIDKLWKQIRTDISGPVFLINHPVEVSPLAKRKADNLALTERYQVIIAGSEMGNGYSELNNPIDQAERFEVQAKMREQGDTEAQMHDKDFVEALEYGMPPATGFGVSERLFAFLVDKPTRECVMFPLLKPIVDNGKISVNTDLSGLPTRAEALALLEKHVQDPYQTLHARMIATVLEKYAEKYGEDPDLWYITGLLHDLDFEEFPDEHVNKELEWFKEWNYPEALIHAVAAHGHMITGIQPQTQLAKALVATDELAGLMYAYAILRPDGFKGMKPKSVKKRIKELRFAPNLSREDINYGLEVFEGDTSEHMQMMIETFASMPELAHVKATPPDAPTDPPTKQHDYSISTELRNQFPGIFYACTIIRNVSIQSKDIKLEQVKRNFKKNHRITPTQDLHKLASIESYREMIQQSGIDPNKHLPSPEALMRRVNDGKDLYTINTAVDAYNLAVLETGIALGGFDLDQIHEPVILRLAQAGETMQLLGKEGVTELKAGQIVYADQEKPITMDLNYRDIEATKITLATQNILLFADGGPGINRSVVLEALQKGADLIMQYCGGKQGDVILVE